MECSNREEQEKFGNVMKWRALNDTSWNMRFECDGKGNEEEITRRGIGRFMSCCGSNDFVEQDRQGTRYESLFWNRVAPSRVLSCHNEREENRWLKRGEKNGESTVYRNRVRYISIV